ncbi:hypothetical protein XA68_13740 [Ophiocordyceps unilateralis]|uniref:Uncharacterized protein n=1 Tax=Ophiocordyceps unilateralis TaxID=268505 RepID=A0A2A9PC27_OPHUN|nr:hypothetical protein XA68_13740 [Ophiocordyceps unilateralis]
MDSLFSFEPFWNNPDVLSWPRVAVDDIRIKSLNLYLNKHKGERPTPLGLDVVIDECIDIIETLFEDSEDDNEILKRLHSIGYRYTRDAMTIFRAGIAIWYSSAAPASTRDPLQGLHPDTLQEFDENGEEYEPWSRSWAAKQHASANLGIVAMLLTSERWVPPVHPLLKAASLVSKSITALLYAVFLIFSTLVENPDLIELPWPCYLESTRPYETMRLFLRSTWSLTRENFQELDFFPPGVEFGTTLNEVGLSHDGSQLLTSIGRGNSWAVPPPWHPVRKTPGSAWNKILRNQMQPVFSESPLDPAEFHLTIPGSCATLVQPFEKYYSQLRSRMDQNGRHRRLVSRPAQIKQFHSLSEKTGQPYPLVELSEDTASFTEEPEQEWLYKLPMVKKPITDLRGYMTFPFMTSLSRAWRFQVEPDEVEPDFYVMSFERWTIDEHKE